MVEIPELDATTVLDNDQEQRIVRTRLENETPYSELAEIYGVSSSTIRTVINAYEEFESTQSESEPEPESERRLIRTLDDGTIYQDDVEHLESGMEIVLRFNELNAGTISTPATIDHTESTEDKVLIYLKTELMGDILVEYHNLAINVYESHDDPISQQAINESFQAKLKPKFGSNGNTNQTRIPHYIEKGDTVKFEYVSNHSDNDEKTVIGEIQSVNPGRMSDYVHFTRDDGRDFCIEYHTDTGTLYAGATEPGEGQRVSKIATTLIVPESLRGETSTPTKQTKVDDE